MYCQSTTGIQNSLKQICCDVARFNQTSPQPNYMYSLKYFLISIYNSFLRKMFQFIFKVGIRTPENNIF